MIFKSYSYPGLYGRCRSRALLFLIFLFTSTSCATSGTSVAPTNSFDAFVSALEEVKTGTQQALSQLQPLAEARFRTEVLAELGDESDQTKPLVTTLQLQFSEQNPLLIEEVPYFLTIPKFKLAIDQATNVMISYAKLLRQLADPDLVSADSFDQLKTDLNGNARSAAKAMNPDLSASAEGDVSVVSDLAASAIGNYLDSKRNEDLLLAINNNQPAIDAYSEQMQIAVDIIGAAALLEYDRSYNDVLGGLFSPTTRQASLESILTLNKNQITTTEKLLSLRDAYGKIAAAHRGLSVGGDSSGGGLGTIVSLIETGKALQTSYEQAVTDNQTARVQAEADKASALADALEAEARLAVLKASNAKLAATQAAIEAQNDPDNSKKANTAIKLTSEAEALDATAKTMLQNAVTLRTAAVEVQMSVSAVTSPSNK